MPLAGHCSAPQHAATPAAGRLQPPLLRPHEVTHPQPPRRGPACPLHQCQLPHTSPCSRSTPLGTCCSTETFPKPTQLPFSHSQLPFFLCAWDTEGTKPCVTSTAHLGQAGTGPCRKQRPLWSPPWHHAGSQRPARMGTGRWWHEMLSQLSPCPRRARSTAGNGLTLMSPPPAQVSPKAPGPDPCTTSPHRGKGNLEMPAQPRCHRAWYPLLRGPEGHQAPLKQQPCPPGVAEQAAAGDKSPPAPCARTHARRRGPRGKTRRDGSCQRG